ncbi:MAG: M1 family metallopeptidase [Flavobacteriales bacterium]|nr:M1 family metallopeptidase [Flavobacteriales bacterium]
MRFLFLFVFLNYSSLLFSQIEKPYFQQEVNYNINVELDDENHELVAFEKITYTNNSTKTLHSIYFHVWPNAYKKYNSALGKQQLEDHNTKLYYAPDSILGYIDGLEFKVGDENLQWSYIPGQEDICNVSLLDPLRPGETVEITTPFNVKIPKGIFSRLGHMGQSYQITQWYPKPAVYDNDGWHQMPYLDQGEFYSEFGTFDVYITLPKNYVVGATGDLVNGEKEIDWLNKKAAITQSKIEDSTIVFMDKGGTPLMNFPLSNDTTKTLHYHQENVHDFAWFADKRYHVLKGEVELPHSKRKVTTWAMFTNNEGGLWSKSIEYLNDATYYYSLWNGDYPYNHVTAVDGALSAGGGMEYPNITVIGESYNDFGLETVIMHEVGHNWFYGILGTNERDHPWMDEGLNSMNENRYIETKYPKKGFLSSDSISDSERYKADYELDYLVNARRNKDQRIEELSANYTPSNYGGIVYSKTAIVFDYLMAYLGEDLYDKCMQRYFNEWKFKHPQPNDLRKVFEEETGKDLSWFFDGIIKTTSKIDYKIAGAKKDTTNPENILLKIRNKGKVHGPFSISGVKDGEIVSTQWYEPIGKKKFVPFKRGDFDNYRIDAQLDIPEVKRKNNTFKTKGLLRTTEPLKLQLYGFSEDPDKTQLYIAPIAGWNMNDKGMFGLAFYNSVIPSKKFEYVLAPLYAINSENVNGYASAFYHIYPSSLFQEIEIGANTASFSYKRVNSIQNSSGKEVLEYYKITPTIKFTFKKKRARQHSSIFFLIENINLYEEEQIWKRTQAGKNEYQIELDNYYVNRFTIGINSSHPINPFNVNAVIQQADNFVKLDLTANYHFAYKKHKTGLDVRIFIGRFLYNKDINLNGNYNCQLSGNSDYLYDQIFLARTPTSATNGVLTQQFAITDGGFKNLAFAENSDGQFINGNKWLNAINIKSNLLTKNLSVYVDFGLVGYNTRDSQGNEIDGVSSAAYNMGISLNIVPNIFEVYFPLYMSSDLNQLNYGEKIRFTLNINTLNPFKLIRNFDL